MSKLSTTEIKQKSTDITSKITSSPDFSGSRINGVTCPVGLDLTLAPHNNEAS